MSKWKSIKSMPEDKFIMLGCWVYHLSIPQPFPEFYLATWCSGDNCFYNQAWEADLPFDEKEDYDFWMDVPKMPEVNK